MPLRSDFKSTASRKQYFGVKITLIVVMIIALSQGLGTFLSVLSFEDIYLRALLSKYEVLGKDLQRKIQQALKFGKPLDRFLGMDRLVEPLFRQAEELSDVFVLGPTGNTLFSFEKVQFVIARGAVDEKEYPRGKVLLSETDDKQPFPTRILGDIRKRGSHIRLYHGKYQILFSIKPRIGGLKGYLGLAFSKALLDMKKKELIRRSINKLFVAVLLTACFVALLIRLLFSEPARRHVEHTSIALEEPERESPDPEPARFPEEILDVQLSIADYISSTHEVKHEVRKSLIRLERVIPEKAYPRQVIRLMKNILAGRSNEGV